MGALAVRTVQATVTRPFSWIPDAVSELSTASRRCFLPLVISHSVYLISYGIILFGAVLGNLGVVDREPGAMYVIWVREIATWITAMIFAGVAGSAVAADLGSRKIREELDALSVLGVEKVRSLVVPRVVALTVAAPAFAVLSLLIVCVVNYIVAPGTLGFSRGIFLSDVAANIIPSDLYAMIIKNTIIGFFVGIVACHKGLTCKGGAEGVGRAVNQTVVITFFGIWMFNSLFNVAYLTLFPQVAVLRG
jgi:phospholipid/cholesterol/gamma-HCH transport system permease protein